MTAVTPARKEIQVEETQFRAAVSESTEQKIGGSINFINRFQSYQRDFYVNGPYSLLTTPFTFIDGMAFIPYNSEIVAVDMFTNQAGSSNTTELDILLIASPGDAGTSIFTTTPKINFAAGNRSYCNTTWNNDTLSYVPSALTNTTAPVLNTVANTLYALNAGQHLILKITTSQGGAPIGTGLSIYMRPR